MCLSLLSSGGCKLTIHIANRETGCEFRIHFDLHRLSYSLKLPLSRSHYSKDAVVPVGMTKVKQVVVIVSYIRTCDLSAILQPYDDLCAKPMS